MVYMLFIYVLLGKNYYIPNIYMLEPHHFYKIWNTIEGISHFDFAGKVFLGAI